MPNRTEKSPSSGEICPTLLFTDPVKYAEKNGVAQLHLAQCSCCWGKLGDVNIMVEQVIQRVKLSLAVNSSRGFPKHKLQHPGQSDFVKTLAQILCLLAQIMGQSVHSQSS